MAKGIERLKWEIVSGLAPGIFYKVLLAEEDKSTAYSIAEILQANPDLNLIPYYNHLSYSDPLFAIHLIRYLDPDHYRHIVVPVSYSKMDPGRPGTGSFINMVETGRRLGIEPLPIIQTYQVDNPDFGYCRDQASATYRNLIKRLKEIKNSKTPIACVISPEGHRSETGLLGQAETGITAIGRILAPVLFVPVGVSYPDGFERNGLNIGRRVTVKIGSVCLQEQVANGPTIDLLMHNLANVLPRPMRGVWDES